jgi:hypothetical protein
MHAYVHEVETWQRPQTSGRVRVKLPACQHIVHVPCCECKGHIEQPLIYDTGYSYYVSATEHTPTLNLTICSFKLRNSSELPFRLSLVFRFSNTMAMSQWIKRYAAILLAEPGRKSRISGEARNKSTTVRTVAKVSGAPRPHNRFRGPLPTQLGMSLQ